MSEEYDMEAGCKLEERMVPFTSKMWEQLERHTNEGSWDGCTSKYLFREMFRHMENARIAIENGASTGYVVKKLANAANYGMMLSDNYVREHHPNGQLKGREGR